MAVPLSRVNLVLADLPAKLRAIADDLKQGMPAEPGMTSTQQWHAATELESYAATIEHIAEAMRASDAGLGR